MSKHLKGWMLTLAVVAGLSGFAARAEDKKIEITANDMMKYSLTAFEVNAGDNVTITLTNAGKLPREAMAHNMVILNPGTDFTAFAQAGMTSPATEYVAPDQASKVFAKTKLLGPGESATLTFTAPAAGTYDYICTFPAHAMAGMHGVMTVK